MASFRFSPEDPANDHLPVNAIASIAEDMPTHIERVLSKLEKKCKKQEKKLEKREKKLIKGNEIARTSNELTMLSALLDLPALSQASALLLSHVS